MQAPSRQDPPVDGLVVSCGSVDISLELACTILAVLTQPHLGLSDAISSDVGNASIWHGSSLAALFERCCQVDPGHDQHYSLFIAGRGFY